VAGGQLVDTTDIGTAADDGRATPLRLDGGRDGRGFLDAPLAGHRHDYQRDGRHEAAAGETPVVQ
jgi:hypothetical protein